MTIQGGFIYNSTLKLSFAAYDKNEIVYDIVHRKYISIYIILSKRVWAYEVGRSRV